MEKGGGIVRENESAKVNEKFSLMSRKSHIY